MYRLKKISFFAMLRLSAVHLYFSSIIRIQNVQVLKINFFAMFRRSADLQFKCVFQRQPVSESEIRVKAESGSGKINFKIHNTAAPWPV
jgi:hypothetical protein